MCVSRIHDVLFTGFIESFIDSWLAQYVIACTVYAALSVSPQ